MNIEKSCTSCGAVGCDHKDAMRCANGNSLWVPKPVDDCATEHMKPGRIEYVPPLSRNPQAKASVLGQCALDVQEGGDHYKDMPIQPVEYIHKNGIGYFEGCVIKYVSRWKKKNGIEDLKKARHFLDLLIEFEDAHRHV